MVNGQVAQLVEQSPEKACVGGSIPSLATTFFWYLDIWYNRLRYNFATLRDELIKIIY